MNIRKCPYLTRQQAIEIIESYTGLVLIHPERIDELDAIAIARAFEDIGEREE